MSFEAYVDELMKPLSDGTTLTHAAIYSHDGGVMAQSASFPGVSAMECAAIMAGFKDPSTLQALMVGGERYMLLTREPGDVLYGKKGPGGVCLKKTEHHIVIAIYGEGVRPAVCNHAVEKLGDYLIDEGM